MHDSISSTNVFVHVEATRAGAGLGLLPCFMADRHEDLVRLLPGTVSEKLDYWLVARPDSLRQPAVAAVVAALKEATEAHRGELLGRR
jgi:DNA-binding transcriptional LysR family regulator